MSKSLVNRLCLLIILMFAILPFVGFFTYKLLGKEEDTFLIIFCIVATFGILLERGNINIEGYIVLFFLFFLYTVLSDAFIVGKSIGFNYIRNNVYLGSVLILVVINNAEVSEAFFERIDKTSFLLLGFATLVIIIQQFYSRTFFTKDDVHIILNSSTSVESRLPSIYSWSGSLAAIGLAFFPILGLFIEREIKNNNVKIYVLLFIFGAIVAIFNKSRFVLLNYLLLFSLLPIHKGFAITNLIKYAVIIGAFGILVYAGAKVSGFDMDGFINQRLLEKNEGGLAEGAAGTRILAFKVFGKLFPANPVFGKGKFHQFGVGENASKDIELVRTLHGRSSQIHVGYLSLLYYYGIIGGLIYFLFLFFTTKKLLGDAKRTLYYAPLLGWLMFVVSNFTLVSLDFFDMGIVLVFFYNKFYLDKKIYQTQ